MGDPEGHAPRLYARAASPEDYQQLATFCCGGSAPWEKEVDNLFQGLGRAGEQESMTVRVTVDMDTGDLAGAAALSHDRIFRDLREQREIENTYVYALGVMQAYRRPVGRQRIAGERSAGIVMTDDLRDVLLRSWDGKEHIVWAIIATENLPCRRLVEVLGLMHWVDAGSYDTWAAYLGGHQSA